MSASKASLYEELILESNDRSRSVDIKLGTISIDYFEDLFSPTITAQVRVVNTGDSIAKEGSKERQSIYNGLPLRGGERLSMKVLDQGKANNKGKEKTGLDFTDPEQNLIVSSITDVISQSERETFLLNLVSQEAITNETTRVFKKYSSIISTSVEKILTDDRIGFKLDRSRYEIDPTSNEYKFIGNLRKPFTTLVWLASKSVTDSKTNTSAGFLFYQTQDGFRFKSIDKLTNQSSKATYTYTEVNESSISKNNDFKILNYTIDRNQNLLEKLRLGTYSSIRMTLDPTNFKMRQQEFKFDEAGIDKLGNEVVLPRISNESNKTLKDVPSRIFSQVLDFGTIEPDAPKLDTPNADPIKYQAQSAMRYNLMMTQLLSITVPCNTDLRAGDIITCQFPKVSRQDSERFDEETSGKYIIKELCHHFDPDRSFTSMKLVRDSFGDA